MHVIFFILMLLLVVFIVCYSYCEHRKTKKAVKERQMVLDNIRTAFIYIDNNYVVQWESTRVLGGKVDRVSRYTQGRRCYETVMGLTHPCPDCPMKSTFETRQEAIGIYHDNGSSVEIKTIPVLNDYGQLNGGVLQIKDITELEDEEQKRLGILERFDFSLRAARLVSWEIEVETRMVTAFTLDIRGHGNMVPIDEYINRNIRPDYRKLFRAKLEPVFSGEQDYFEICAPAYHSLTGNKQYDWVLTKGKSFNKTPENPKGRIFGTQQIVTSELIRQKELENTNSQMALMFEAANINPWELDLETLYFSSIYANVFEAGNITLDTYYTYINPEDHPTVEKALNRVLKEGKNTLHMQIRISLPEMEGEERWFEISGIVSEYENQGEPSKMIGIRRDIMYLKHTDELIELREKAEEANRLKSTFLANMSHEIRTPLNAIVGFSQLIMEELKDNVEIQEYFNIIETNNELLLGLINDILDLSSIEAGKMQFVYNHLRAGQLFNPIALVYEGKMKEGVAFRTQWPENAEEPELCFDQRRVTQVITNFLNNAIKYTAQGSITLGFSYTKDDIHVFVSDTGKGIAAEYLPHVFERFAKFDKYVAGTGLGLSVCQSIIEKQGGTIGVDSEIGKGSTFWFRLPLTVDN